MTDLLNAPLSAIASLRGELGQTSVVTPAWVADFRRRADDALVGEVGPQHFFAPLIIRSSSMDIRSFEGTPSPLASARGVLLTYVLRLVVAGAEVRHPLLDAMQAWRCDAGHSELQDVISHLSADDSARLTSEIEAHAVTLRQHLGDLSPTWQLRTNQRASIRVANDAVMLRDTIDLMIGEVSGADCRVGLLDITSSPLHEHFSDVLDYHALVQTLRTGSAPLRVAGLSTATGETLTLEVTEASLERALSNVMAAVIRLVQP